MTIDRRGFLYAGGLTAAAAPFSAAAHAAAGHGGKSVTDFGVEPNAERDQTEAIQRAIDELTRLRQPILFPGGVFTASTLTIPNVGALIGIPGMTHLKAKQIRVKAQNDPSLGFVTISGLLLAQERGAGGDPFFASDTNVSISNCRFFGAGKTAVKLGTSPAIIRDTSFEGWSDPAIVSASENLAVSECHFQRCGVGIGTYPGSVTSLAGNRFDDCAIGGVIAGTAILSGNIVTKAAKFGFRLGSGKGAGHILAQGNLVRDCRIAIAVSASGEDIMVSQNMISGAKDGAIRAFDGDKLVGPDLARQSAEAYLNLMVAGNVVR